MGVHANRMSEDEPKQIELHIDDASPGKESNKGVEMWLFGTFVGPSPPDEMVHGESCANWRF